MSCKSCGDDLGDNIDPPLPSGDSAAIPVPTPGCVTTAVTSTTVCPPAPVIKQLCSTIKDECHSCPTELQPLAKMANTSVFALPACDQTVDVTFDHDVSGLMPGLDLYGVDSTGRTIRLRITIVTPLNKLTLKNVCSSCCASTKPVGESIPIGTLFSWSIPQCCTSGPLPGTSDCLVGTFFFPAAGATNPANVENAFNFAVGGIYSLGGFLWKVAARVTDTQILLQNIPPGNGSVVGGFLDGGTDGVCVYPITPVSDVDECNDAAVAAVTLVGCTPTGKKKLSGAVDCGVIVYKLADGTFSVKAPFGGSSSSGPHYIDYDVLNPCNSKLVYSPDLLGAACATLVCSLFLTPANTSNEYEVEISTTAPFTVSAPNNIVTIGNRQFTVVAIITAGTPGKIRVVPRFVVTVSETIPAQTKVCLIEGCQPFPASDWTFGGSLDANGMKVYCSTDGLRSMPDHNSLINSLDFSDPTNVNVAALGNHDMALVTVGITNPSVTRIAEVSAILSMVYQLRLAADGEWFMDTLVNVDAAPVATPLPVRAIPITPDYDQNVVVPFALTLNPGQTRTIEFIARVRTTNSSATPGCLFRGYLARLVTHLTTTV